MVWRPGAHSLQVSQFSISIWKAFVDKHQTRAESARNHVQPICCAEAEEATGRVTCRHKASGHQQAGQGEDGPVNEAQNVTHPKHRYQ